MISDKIVRLRFANRTLAEYVNLVTDSVGARDFFAACSSGTSGSMQNITREQILSLPVPVPPLSEQRRILDRLNVVMPLVRSLTDF